MVLRYISEVMQLMQRCQSTDYIMFLSGSSIKMNNAANGEELQGIEVGETL